MTDRITITSHGLHENLIKKFRIKHECVCGGVAYIYTNRPQEHAKRKEWQADDGDFVFCADGHIGRYNREEMSATWGVEIANA